MLPLVLSSSLAMCSLFYLFMVSCNSVHGRTLDNLGGFSDATIIYIYTVSVVSIKSKEATLTYFVHIVGWMW